MAKGVFTDAELEAELEAARTWHQASRQTFLELEAIVDPETQQAQAQFEDYLRRRAQDADPEPRPCTTTKRDPPD